MENDIKEKLEELSNYYDQLIKRLQEIISFKDEELKERDRIIYDFVLQVKELKDEAKK